MSEYSVEEVRARFSTWASNRGLDLDWIPTGTYRSIETHRAWQGYSQAFAERIKADEGAVPLAWLEAEPGASLESLQSEFGMFVHSMQFHVGKSKPTNRPALNKLFPLFTRPPAQADKPPQLGGCCCGEPCTLGVVHRTDGPCFHYVEPSQAAQVDKSAATRGHLVAWNAICGCLDRLSPGWITASPGSAFERAIKAIETLAKKPTAEPVAQGEAAKFGHHPDPATDFCVEVEALLGEIENHRIGFENGTPPRAELDARIERALSFRVGGDPHAVMAKQQLRAATIAEPVSHRQMVPLAAFEPALVALRRTAECFNDENDANVSRAMFDALTTIGWLEKTGRRLWSITTLGESALAAQPRAVPDGLVSVPREPSRAMKQAGKEATHIEDFDTLEAECVYKAMLAAAPSPGESA